MNKSVKVGGQKESDVYQDKNCVALDQIWKDHVHKIAHSAKKWPEEWGFLNGKVSHFIEYSKFKFLKLDGITILCIKI